jgi:hypothetical protein
VIVRSGGLDFEALQLRLHPAESRVRLLAKEMPYASERSRSPRNGFALRRAA